MRKTNRVYLAISAEIILKKMGDNIRLARLRRDISVRLVCERANISRATLWKIEKGDPSVSMGAYAAVLHGLGGMDKDLSLVAKDDKLGHTLQNHKIDVRKRASGGDIDE